MGNVAPFAKAQQQVLGEDHAYPMIAFNTMKAPAAWKLYAKSQNIPFEISNEVSGQLKKYEMAVKHADEDDKDSISPDDYIESQYVDIYNKSKDYQSLVTSWSIAPCSYLLYQGSIRREVGLVMIKDHLCCCLDGHAAEEHHFLKNDLLKVSVVNMMYRAYERAGLEIPDVQELLRMCPPDDPAWSMYAKGCTLSLNQVEQTGTSSRVSDYKPKNISELCAFVAAIRPGFKSMYKTFASRVPFDYNLKAFDDLIQTEEMPNSFVLYQEQEMASLHYAGIPMDECYTAIKNIAKKRAEKVLAYKDKFVTGMQNAAIAEGKTTTEAQDLSNALWQIIEDSASYLFNASHAYCVSVDSLYGAWLKAHHPFEFYEVALSIAEEKGDKDKMVALQTEASDYFKIKFEPFRYGQDNRSILCHPEDGTITNKLSAIKGFGSGICDTLYECSQQQFTRFVDVLKWLYSHSVKAAAIKPLIQIDYFMQFGNVPTLCRIMDFFELLGEGQAKKFKKEKVKDAAFKEILERHATDKNAKGKELTQYTITDIDGLLYELEDYLLQAGIPDLDMKVRVQNSLDILGFIGIQTGRKEDRCKLIIVDMWPSIAKATGKPWAYCISTQSLGTGRSAVLTVPLKLVDETKISKGDIIQTTPQNVRKNDKGYWWIYDFKKI